MTHEFFTCNFFDPPPEIVLALLGSGGSGDLLDAEASLLLATFDNDRTLYVKDNAKVRTDIADNYYFVPVSLIRIRLFK